MSHDLEDYLGVVENQDVKNSITDGIAQLDECIHVLGENADSIGERTLLELSKRISELLDAILPESDRPWLE